MKFILRKLDRRAAFHALDWIPKGDVSADALSDLRTTGNTLSVWQIDEDRTNLERVVAALAAGRMKLDKLDYALLDRTILDSLGVSLVNESGCSCDADANALWHQDIIGLSGSKLLELAFTLQAHAEFARVQKKAVGDLISTSVDNGFIDVDLLQNKLRQDLIALG